MKAKISRWFEDAWYQEMYMSAWFMPLSMFYVDAIRLRRFLYRTGLKKSVRLPVPVVIVGNLTVGGTGKTPLVIWLVRLLKQQGYKPGVISRGYAGGENAQPLSVTASSDPRQVGDEALLLARRCDCPVAVCAERPAAGRHLLAEQACDVIISDDGLQHYALQRDIEIVVIDGQRRFGNGYCLPVGPLREPPERVNTVDFVVVNEPKELLDGELAMHCRGDQLVNLRTGEIRSLAEFKDIPCHAVAGIGNPQRFFAQLAAAGLDCQAHAFPDHHPFVAGDLQFKDAKPVIMTEKDAVKCAAFAQPDHWYLPVDAELPEAFTAPFLTLLKDKTDGQKTA
ncbi:tetraacyldisaccharide 4'-kinase [Methylomonas methanica]|uniref:Tetraacyldisaccharide 4'-kinase n=1 Tax=Methylomonas methanica (strain DSM 25384 / MC09) TaxID=857087 RepID=F9ZYE9_METMM|nr:tetraacyldisaccharide 4'-kinase [Methylomonas methanica]AEG01054.1 Tetraacyldisaccharide 4'-kinase [Methylomonas methanica MC09]